MLCRMLPVPWCYVGKRRLEEALNTMERNTNRGDVASIPIGPIHACGGDES